MKTIKTIVTVLIFTVICSGLINAQTKPVKRLAAPYFTIAPTGGILFPVGQLGDNLRPGPSLGLDLGYRINKEVGVYGKVGFSFMNSKTDGIPSGRYVEFSAGPRYYMTKPNLSSTLFLEAGVGAYQFNREGYNFGVIPVPEVNDTKIGVNGGIGANLALTKTIDIMIKAKYHSVFTEGGSSSFITALGGIEFKLK
ncbi:MAG: outer membrane beta-barrel protein [bacterium]|nr:outer membrane beta-barrel protein [bacterium]